MAKAKTPKAPAFPLFGDLTEKKMLALGEKLDKLLDENGFKHFDLLGKNTTGPNQLLLWHLVRCGLVAKAPQSAGLYRRLGEYIPNDVSAADVILVLRHVPADMGVLDRGKARQHTMLTPGMLTAIDELLVHAYVADPAAIRAVQPELPENLQIAIDFVRRRAGETIEPARARRILEHLVAHHSASSLGLNIDVPRIVDGKPVESRLADDARVLELAGLFGSADEWAELQLAWVRARVALFRLEGDNMAQRTLPALRGASLRDLIYLFGTGYWNAPALVHVLDRREDSTDALLGAAGELLRDGLAPFRIDAAQIKPEDERSSDGGGNDEDGGDDDYGDSDSDDDYSGDDDYSDDGDGSSGESEEQEAEPEAGPDNDRVKALAEALTVVAIDRLAAKGLPIPASCDAAFDFDRVFESTAPFVLRIRAALGHLGPARAHVVIRRVLAKQFYFGKAAAIADICFDPGVVDEVLDRLDASEYGVDADLLGFCGPQLIPAIVAHAAKANQKAQEGYREAINYILARAFATGQSWDPALDEHIELRAIRFSYGGSKVSSVLALLDGLPLARYEQVMRRNMARTADEPWILVRCLRIDTPDALQLAVFTALMKRSAGVTSGCLGDRLRTLGTRVVAPLREAFGDTPAQGSLMRELERALDYNAFAEFKASLDRPIETREQELHRLCAALPGPKVRIYRLSRSERAPAADEVGRIGGTPRGVKADDVPRLRDEPMEHVITLDLARLPGMKGPRDARSVSLYLPDPDHGEHHDSGRLLWRSEAALADAPGSVADARAIEVEAFDVPAAIFRGGCEGELERVRGMVYTSHGYALGGPLWLQDGPEGEDPDFLFQFDDGLCSINLGDCGVMYVFGSDISWQCH
jgi:hypothetical protein